MENSITIFIADDDKKVRMSAQELWEIKGVTAHCFESGIDILAELRTQKVLPTAALVDFVMEGGGVELVQTLKKEFPGLPVIVYTGLNAQGSMSAYTLGAYAVMQKPLDYNELHETLKELSSRDQIFTQLAHDALFLTKWETCLVWQYDKLKKQYRIVGWSGDVDDEFIKKNTMEEDDFPRVHRMKDGKILLIKDIENEPTYRLKEEAKKRNWVSLIAIPLIRDKRLIGWIDCYKHREKYEKKSEEDWGNREEYLNIYARQATEALHSTVLTQQLRILHETNQNLAGTLDNKLIYKNILTKSAEVTGADYGWIYECDNGRKILKIGECYGFDESCADEERSLESGGITGFVAKSGVSLYVPNVFQASENYTPEMRIPILGVKSVLSIPLRRSDRTLGVLTLKSKHEDFFTPEDSQLMTALAAIAALSVERSKLTTHLSEISRRAREATDFDALLQYVVNAVRDLTDADVNLWMPSKKENEGDEWMRIVCSSKNERNPDYDNYLNTAKAPITLGSSLIANALHGRKHVIKDDLFKPEQNELFYNKAAIFKYEWHSFMCIPMIGKKGEPLGAISLFSSAINKFSDDDGRLLQHFANQAALALQEQKSIAVLQELTLVGQDLTVGLPGTQKLLKKVAAMARKITKSDFTVLYPFDVDKADYYDKDLHATDGHLRSQLKEITERPRINGMAAFVRRTGILIVEHIADDNIIIKTGINNPVPLPHDHVDYQLITSFIRNSKIIKRENVQAFIGIPLRAGDKEIGKNTTQNSDVAVLYINFRAPHHFSEEDLQVLDIYCNQVANIIHRNRLFDSVTRQRKVLDSLSSSATHIMASQDEKARLDSIVNEAVKLLKAKGGKIYLTVNGSQQDLKLVAAYGLTSGLMEIGDILAKTKGMAGKVVRSKKPQMTSNYATYKYRIPEFTHGFSAVIEVPLMIGKEVIGVLCVFDNKESRVFRNDDLTILSRLADQAALSIFNSRLYDELDALYQTSTQIVSQADLKDMAVKILKELKRIISYDRASFQLIKKEEDKRELLAVEGFELDQANPDLLQSVQEDKLIYPVFQSKKILILPDTHKEPLWEKAIESTKDIRSWVCVPLVYEEKVQGFILLDHYQPGYYQPKDAVKLERFAAIAAIALYNSSIDQRHLVELQKFANRVTQLSPTETVENIFLESVKIIQSTFEPIKFIFHYKDEDYFTMRQGLLPSFPDNFYPQPLNISEGLASWVAQTGDAKLYPDDFDTSLFPIAECEQGQSLLFAPIWREGIVVGVLEIVTKTTDYDHNRKNFLSTLILQASQAIQQIEQRERRSEAVKTRFNPYILGTPVRNPEHFYGRTEVLEDIINGIYNNNYAVIDERRLGKTSLLFRLEYELKYHQKPTKFTLFPEYFSLQGVAEHSFYPLLINKIRQALQLNNIEITDFQGYDYYRFRLDLDAIKRDIKKTDSGQIPIVILLIDEVDTLRQYLPIIQDQLRSILVEERLLRVVMAGYKIDFEQDSHLSPWYNFLKVGKIGAFTVEDAKELITKPVAGYYVYQPEAIELIIEKSALKPLDIQYYCSAALSGMFRRIGNPDAGVLPVITLEDVQQIKPENTPSEFSI